MASLGYNELISMINIFKIHAIRHSTHCSFTKHPTLEAKLVEKQNTSEKYNTTEQKIQAIMMKHNKFDIDNFVQDCSDSIANALELP